MALIKCMECGRKISEKTVSCLYCGYPISEFENMDNDDNKVDKLVKTVNRIHRIYPTEKVKAIKELRKYTGIRLGEAINIIDKEYRGEGIYGLAVECVEKKNAVLLKSSVISNISRDDYKKGGVFTKIKCPRCLSIEYQVIDTKKKFSFSRALAGNIIGGLISPAGAVVGATIGMQGKNGKTKFVCSHCGKIWEQKV